MKYHHYLGAPSTQKGGAKNSNLLPSFLYPQYLGEISYAYNTWGLKYLEAKQLLPTPYCIVSKHKAKSNGGGLKGCNRQSFCEDPKLEIDVDYC